MDIKKRSFGAKSPFQPLPGMMSVGSSQVEVLFAITLHLLMSTYLSDRFNISNHSTSGNPMEGVASINNSVITRSLNLAELSCV